MNGPLTPEAARKEAQKLLAKMTTRNDPVLQAAKQKIATVTLAEVLDRYLSELILGEYHNTKIVIVSRILEILDGATP